VGRVKKRALSRLSIMENLFQALFSLNNRQESMFSPPEYVTLEACTPHIKLACVQSSIVGNESCLDAHFESQNCVIRLYVINNRAYVWDDLGW